jgi:hypothetical protein
MPLAQVIRFEERKAAARPPRLSDQPLGGIILKFTRFPERPATGATHFACCDDDRSAGRGRDPG